MLPERLGPYRIVRKIGRGGMGMVFLGVDDTANQTAAVKLLPGDMAAQADFRERFKAEIDTLRKLNHPNIVRIFGYGEQDDQIFYGMEYVSGSSLEEQIGRGRAFQWREVAQMGIEVARALRHAHDRGIIHRDIKPGNLLLTDEGQIKLSDFGIARLFGNARLTGAGSVMGTAEFMAPEQAEGRAVDPRSDLYSLGGVLYVLLARRPLYEARSFLEMLEKQRSEKPLPLRSVAADVPAELEQIIHRLLEKDPERRFATALVLERRLDSMLESFSVPPAVGTIRVTVDPAPVGLPPGVDPPLADPLAVTVPATQRSEYQPPSVAEVPERLAGEENEDGDSGPDVPADKPDVSAVSPQDAASRFIPVRPGELDHASPERPESTWFSAQFWALTIGLLALAILAWYMLQPPTADKLYQRIERQTADGSDDSLQQAEDDIRQFLARFPADPHAAALNDDLERIETSRLERRLELQAKGLKRQTALSPVESCYIDAVHAARIDPDSGIAKFQAMIDLFEARQENSGPDGRCIELAKRRLKELSEQSENRHKEQLSAVEMRLRYADELAKTDRQRAAAIRRAVIVLYDNKPWAKEIVKRARTALEKP